MFFNITQNLKLVITVLFSMIIVSGSFADDNKTNIKFRYNDITLYKNFGDNSQSIKNLKNGIDKELENINKGGINIRIVSLIPTQEKNNLIALNVASVRGASVREYIKENYPSLTDSNFEFFISPSENKSEVEISFSDAVSAEINKDIYFSVNLSDHDKINSMFSYYDLFPYLNSSDHNPEKYCDISFLDPKLDPTETMILIGKEEMRFGYTVYFKLNSDKVEKGYMNNGNALSNLDSLLNKVKTEYIDSMLIRGFASPDGSPNYNKKLSARRAQNYKNYILSTFPSLDDKNIIIEGMGENWEELRFFVKNDTEIPHRDKLIEILNDEEISDFKRQKMIEQLDNSCVYKDYLLPKYYNNLRSGASLFVYLNPGMLMQLNFEPVEVKLEEPQAPQPVEEVIPEPEIISKSYFALKSNMLSDVTGMLNLGIEVPVGNRFSLMVDGSYGNWVTKNDKYAMKGVFGSVEARYWFTSFKTIESDYMRDKKSLSRFFIGLHGIGGGKYDVQVKKGIQGDSFYAFGVNGGYSLSLNRSLNLEFNLGIGAVHTPQCRYFNEPEEGHLIWRKTKNDVSIFPMITKLGVSLVWMIPVKRTVNKDKNDK